MADTTGQPRARRFDIRRGFILDYTNWKLDSTRRFREGKHTYTHLSPELDRLARIMKDPFVQFFDKEKPRNFRRFNERFGTSNFINIAGFSGDQVSAAMSFYVVGEEDFPISLLEKPDHITVNDFKNKLSPGVHRISLTVNLPPGVSQQVIRLSGPDKKVYDITLALRGYDLTEASFIPNGAISELKQIDASEREHLFLCLESTEKLLKLFQGDKLRFRVPVGRQIDQIPVYHLPPGDYRIEIIDLSTGEKRSYGLKR